MAIAPAGRIARKNVRITFQQNEVYCDQYKNRLRQWSDYYSCSAYASTYAAAEDGDAVTSEEKGITFETRWCPELAAVTSTGFRIVFRDENYNILSIDPMNYQGQAIRFACMREKRPEV